MSNRFQTAEHTTPARLTFTRSPIDGYYDGSDGNTYVAIVRGRANPVITGYLQLFYDHGTCEHYSVPGSSRFVDAEAAK